MEGKAPNYQVADKIAQAEKAILANGLVSH